MYEYVFVAYGIAAVIIGVIGIAAAYSPLDFDDTDA